jgi:anti-sigma regulatory factor (Ser/Thr protein kinase)
MHALSQIHQSRGRPVAATGDARYLPMLDGQDSFRAAPAGERPFKERRLAGETVGFERLGAWHVSAVPRCVPELRRALLATIAGRGFDEDAVALAATEAVTNVVRHAYQAPGGSVTMTATASPDELVVVVADDGIGLRSLTLQSDATGRGMGLALIRELCAHVRIEPTHAGTTLTMRFTKHR